MTARLTAELSRIAGEAFAAEGLSETYGQVQVSDRPDRRNSSAMARWPLPRRLKRTRALSPKKSPRG